MATIFNVETSQGVDPSGSTFSQQGVVDDLSAPIQALAPQAVKVHGGVVQAGTESKIEEEQNQFLATEQAAKSELAQLRKDNPQEAEISDKAQARIGELKQFMKGGGIRATEATARIEALKREAAGRAPLFKREIMALTGEQGGLFDAEAERLIEERAFRSRDALQRGLDIDDQRDEAEYENIKAQDRQIARLTRQNTLTSEEGRQVLGGTVANAVSAIMNTFDKGMKVVNGNPKQLSEELRLGALTKLQTLTNGGERSFINALLVKQLGPERAARVSAEIRAPYEALVKGLADARIKQLDGSIPKGVRANDIASLDDRFMLDLAQNNPVLYQQALLLSRMPDSLGKSALGETVGKDLLRYTQWLGKQQPISLNDETFDREKTRVAQRLTADNFRTNREFWETAPNPDRETLIGHAKMLQNQMEGMRRDPRGFDTKLYDEVISSINSTNFRNLLTKMDPEEAIAFARTASHTVQIYAREKLGRDILDDLNDEVSSYSVNPRLVAGGIEVETKNVPVSHILATNVASDGTLEFTPRGGIDHRDLPMAEKLAAKLTKMYTNRTTRLSSAVQSLGNQFAQEGDTKINPHQAMSAVYGGAQLPLGVDEVVYKEGEPSLEEQHAAFEKKRAKFVTDFQSILGSMAGPTQEATPLQAPTKELNENTRALVASKQAEIDALRAAMAKLDNLAKELVPR